MANSLPFVVMRANRPLVAATAPPVRVGAAVKRTLFVAEPKVPVRLSVAPPFCVSEAKVTARLPPAPRLSVLPPLPKLSAAEENWPEPATAGRKFTVPPRICSGLLARRFVVWVTVSSNVRMAFW